MLNKRGEITTNEVIKMVIGIIILGFMIYLGVKLAGIITMNRDMEQAKGSLGMVIDKIDACVGHEEVENAMDTILIEGPKKWYFIVKDSDTLCFCNDMYCSDQKALVCSKFKNKYFELYDMSRSSAAIKGHGGAISYVDPSFDKYQLIWINVIPFEIKINCMSDVEIWEVDNPRQDSITHFDINTKYGNTIKLTQNKITDILSKWNFNRNLKNFESDLNGVVEQAQKDLRIVIFQWSFVVSEYSNNSTKVKDTYVSGAAIKKEDEECFNSASSNGYTNILTGTFCFKRF